jgi:hypothetical protein
LPRWCGCCCSSRTAASKVLVSGPWGVMHRCRLAPPGRKAGRQAGGRAGSAGVWLAKGGGVLGLSRQEGWGGVGACGANGRLALLPGNREGGGEQGVRERGPLLSDQTVVVGKGGG